MGIGDVAAVMGGRALGYFEQLLRAAVSVLLLYVILYQLAEERTVRPSHFFIDLDRLLGIPTAGWAAGVQAWMLQRPDLIQAFAHVAPVLLLSLGGYCLLFLFARGSHFIEMRATSTAVFLALCVAEAGRPGWALRGLLGIVLVGAVVIFLRTWVSAKLAREPMDDDWIDTVGMWTVAWGLAVGMAVIVVLVSLLAAPRRAGPSSRDDG